MPCLVSLLDVRSLQTLGDILHMFAAFLLFIKWSTAGEGERAVQFSIKILKDISVYRLQITSAGEAEFSHSKRVLISLC